MGTVLLSLVLYPLWLLLGTYTFLYRIEKETGKSTIRKGCFLFICGPGVWLACLAVLLIDYFKGRN